MTDDDLPRLIPPKGGSGTARPKSAARMPGPVTITVTGPRASGKTLTALRLVALLRAMGFTADYRGRSKWQEDQVRDLLLVPGAFLDARLPQSFVVEDRT